MNSIKYSYLFWGAGILGLNGCHRLYNGKIVTGLVWFFTLGLFGVGQLIDLFLIPGMVEEHNAKVKPKLNISSHKIKYSYLFWGAGILGLNGCHRLYNGKIVTGLVWLFTFGLFGVGQLIDLFLIPRMVEEHNAKVTAKLDILSQGVPLYKSNRAIAFKTSVPQTRQQLMVALLKAASTKGGKLSITQGVMATGANFAEVEETMKEMLKTGYVSVDNHPETGIVIYDFHEL